MAGPEGHAPARLRGGESRSDPANDEQLVLAELVSRVLDRGVVVAGDVTISVAGIDLVRLDLRLHASSVETLRVALETAEGEHEAP